jgi:hypothetical protein
MRWTSFLLLVWLAPCATAQPEVSTPTLGYAYDPGLRAIRTIRGIPGAALLAEIVDGGFAAVSATVAPSQDFALAVSSTGEVRIVDWRSGTPTSTILADAMNAPDGLTFSGSGTAAVLSDSQSGHIQVVTSLPDAPAIREIVPAGGSTPAAAIAVADDGTVAWATGDGVQFVGTDLAPFSLPLPSGVVALVFAASNHDLLAATSAGDLYLAKDAYAGADIRKIDSDSRLANPVAVQFSADGSTAFVAGQAGTLAYIDLNAGTTATVSCQCAPSGFDRLGHTDRFRLTGISNRPVFFFDGTPQRQRLWFVPAPDPRNAQ